MTSRLHHVALTAADLPTTARFYDAVLGPLGYRRTHSFDTICVWGGQSPEVLLYPVEDADTSPHRKGQLGLQHLAFDVADRATVDLVHDAAVAGGWSVVLPPREYEYSEGYYAVFIEDPDGSRLEVLNSPNA